MEQDRTTLSPKTKLEVNTQHEDNLILHDMNQTHNGTILVLCCRVCSLPVTARDPSVAELDMCWLGISYRLVYR